MTAFFTIVAVLMLPLGWGCAVGRLTIFSYSACSQLMSIPCKTLAACAPGRHCLTAVCVCAIYSATSASLSLYNAFAAALPDFTQRFHAAMFDAWLRRNKVQASAASARTRPVSQLTFAAKHLAIDMGENSGSAGKDRQEDSSGASPKIAASTDQSIKHDNTAVAG